MKKLLLISYYFPPCGGAPVQRWLRFLPRLVERGWRVTVICPEDGNYPAMDETLLDKVPSQVRVIRCGNSLLSSSLFRLFKKRVKLPYGDLRTKQEDGLLKRLLIWIRLNLVIPDIRVTWNNAAYRAAMQELSLDRYDAVITTGPPHSTHLVGKRIKDRLPIKWITDFRDPWSEVYYLKLNPPSKLTMSAHKRLERQVISTADANIIVSDNIAAQLPEGNKHVIYNGFDPRDFAKSEYTLAESFRIRYIGMVTAGQDVHAIPASLERIISQSEVELMFIGNHDPHLLQDLRQTSGMLNITERGFIPHKDAIDAMVNCELLILLINDYTGNEGMLTTKLFEYMASGTPILCLGNPVGEAAKAIMTSGKGACFDYYADAAKTYVESLYIAWQNKTPIRTTGDIVKYSVDDQIDRLIELLS